MEKYSFKVGSLAETSYKKEPEMLEEWEQFYLPDHMYMEVIGVLEKFSCNSPNDELVLMVCEDGKVFAYEGNRLHLISNNLKDLFERGLQFPAIKEYYRAQSFEDMVSWTSLFIKFKIQNKLLIENLVLSIIKSYKVSDTQGESG